MDVIPVCIDAEITRTSDFAALVASSCAASSACCGLRDGDILVVSQKAISKSEGRIVELESVRPSELAQGIASQYKKDPRIVEVVLCESESIVRMYDGIIITQTRSGIVCANAGVDESNVPHGYATLLPDDPDASAIKLQKDILAAASARVSVIISDTFGRPFRMGQTDCAIGVAGLCAISDYGGAHDVFGRQLRVTAVAVADEIASAAELVMAKTRMCPAAVIRRYDADHVRPCDGDDIPCTAGSKPLLRDKIHDLFR